MIYAVTNKTAAELIVSRADANQPNLALTSWKGNIVRKQDIYIAKNYLRDDEIDLLNRLTVLFLDSAELRVKERKDLTLGYWRKNVDALLDFQNKEVLKNTGSISNKQMENIVDAVYEEFNTRRKLYAIETEDEKEKDELILLEYEIKTRKKD